MKTVEEMVTALTSHGYGVGPRGSKYEAVNIWEQGLTYFMRKKMETGGHLTFSFWSDNQGGSDFWVCELEHHFRLAESKWWTPAMTCKIYPILEEHLGLLPEFEQRILRPEYSAMPQLLVIEKEMLAKHDQT